MELMVTIASITAIAAVAAIGIAALPWTEREVTETLGAVDALPETLGGVSRAARPAVAGVAAR